MTLFDLIKEERFKFDEKDEYLVFEAFSGYGSQMIALNILGKEINKKFVSVGISEIDKSAIKAHKLFHGEQKNYGDIEKMNQLPECDIATWSFPCQDISKAGKQKGMIDCTRSNYGYVFLEVLRKTKIKPKILLMENVKALNEKTFEYDKKRILDELSECGYRNYVNVLNAKNFDIPQSRKRIFILSILDDDRPYKWNDGKPTEKRLKDFRENGDIDEKYFLSAKMISFLYNNSNKQKELGNGFRFTTVSNDDITKTITTRSGNRMDDNFLIEVGKLTDDGKDRPRHRVYDSRGITTTTTKLDQLPYYLFDGLLPNGEYTLYEKIGSIFILEDAEKRAFIVDVDDEKNLSIPSATTEGYTKTEEEEDAFYIDRPHQKRGVVQRYGTPTLKTQGNDIGYYTGKRIRKLTVREVGRLMGLDDFHIDLLLNSDLSHTAIMKLFGNSIVVNVLVEIFRNLF